MQTLRAAINYSNFSSAVCTFVKRPAGKLFERFRKGYFRNFRVNGYQVQKMGDDENGANGGEDKNLQSKLTQTILKLEKVDENLYRANYLWQTHTRGVFGGQIIGQALVASGNTVPPELQVHSMHSYFLLAGDGTRPIIYHVEKMRDGRSFSTRLVKAVQNGEVIYTCMVSYHKNEPSPVSHQYKMPEVAPPDSLRTYQDLLRESLEKGELTEYQQTFAQRYLAEEMTFDLKPVEKYSIGIFKFKNSDSSRPRDSRLAFWVKMKGKLDESQHNLHRSVAAYISDSYLLSTALLTIPWNKYVPSMMASLDHSLWFHSHFAADEWMLYECESPRMVGSRALAFGRIWKQDGTLAVSVAQEGLVRLQALL